MDRIVADDATPASTPCRRCRKRLTWAARRAQYGRMKRARLADADIKAVAPICQKCLTLHLASKPTVEPAPDAR